MDISRACRNRSSYEVLGSHVTQQNEERLNRHRLQLLMNGQYHLSVSLTNILLGMKPCSHWHCSLQSVLHNNVFNICSCPLCPVQTRKGKRKKKTSDINRLLKREASPAGQAVYTLSHQRRAHNAGNVTGTISQIGQRTRTAGLLSATNCAQNRVNGLVAALAARVVQPSSFPRDTELVVLPNWLASSPTAFVLWTVARSRGESIVCPSPRK